MARPTRRALWRAASFAGAALLAVFVLYLSPAGQPLRSRARWFAEDPWGGARPLLWRDSLRMGLARPLAGHGPETFTAAFPHYESAALARAYPDFAHESPHNIFLDALVGQGIAGLLLLAAWCALGFAAAWKIRGQHPRSGRGPGCRARRRNRQPAVHGVHHPHGGDLLRHHRARRGPGRRPRRTGPPLPVRPSRCSISPRASPSPITRWRWRSAISPPAISPPPPRTTRLPARPAICGTRAPCSPLPAKRP